MLQWGFRVRQWAGPILTAGLIALSFSSAQAAQTSNRLHLHSAVRFPGESFAQAFARYQKRIVQFGGHRVGVGGVGTTVSQAAVPLESLSHETVPVWSVDAAKADQAFKAVRDLRFIKDDQHPGFLRRSTWMYPDDGCFARAALMVANLANMRFVLPAKIFIFGDLTVKTVNSPSGEVGWWYHVAPIVRIGQQEFIIDPAINPDHALTLNDWIRAMRPDGNLSGLKFAVCVPHSYVPSDICTGSIASDERAMIDQQTYLPLEWDRLIELKRNPERELGDFPEWLVPSPALRRF